MSEHNDELIDIDSVLESKLGRRARYVPRPLTAWLKRIIHQDDLNEFIGRTGDLEGLPWLDAAVDRLHLTLHIEGLDRLPDDSDGRRFTFVSNHPLGGPDGIVLGKILGHRYNGRICYLVNDLLMNLHGLAPLCVPINKTGRQGKDFPRLVEGAFQGDRHVIMFPAGICSRRIDGVIQDLPWKKAFITKSVETGRWIVPIYFSGRNSDRFYRWAAFGKRLGLKFNIAMLLLVDEMFRHEGDTFTIRIGQPIPPTRFDRSHTAYEWAQGVRKAVYNLAREAAPGANAQN